MLFGRFPAIVALALLMAACDTAGPENEPPSAAFSFSPQDVRAGMTIEFAASAQDPDGTIHRHSWDFDGDAEEDAAGPTAAHVYAVPGDYDVTLTVYDDGGATDAITQTVPVGDLYASVIITSVTIEDLPFERGGGEPWDADSGPDLYYRVVDAASSQLARSDVVFDVEPSDLPVTPPADGFTIGDLSSQYRFQVLDEDEEGSDELIRTIGYVFDNLVGEYPDEVRLDIGNRLALFVELEWTD